jgi:hypothetical protein
MPDHRNFGNYMLFEVAYFDLFSGSLCSAANTARNHEDRRKTKAALLAQDALHLSAARMTRYVDHFAK